MNKNKCIAEINHKLEEKNKVSKILDKLVVSKKIEKVPIIYDIEHSLEQIKEYNIRKEKILDELEFKEILHDDTVDFQDESILRYFKSLNFIPTENSKKKLNFLCFCIKNGYHILITGQTSSGKTYLSEVICQLLQKNMIKYNCDENSEFSDIKSTSVENLNNFDEIKNIRKHLIKALRTKNSVFLMDCVNLASIKSLESIESMLDCGYFTYEDNGKFIKIDIPKDFCFLIIANTYKGKLYGKKQILAESFKNKFISIEFPEIRSDELYNIAFEEYKSFGLDKILKNSKNFIVDFISFLGEWSKNEKIKNYVACLTLRDILAALKIISEGEDPTETIMNIYGERYVASIKNEMEGLLMKYESFKFYKPNYEKIKNEFSKNCFINSNILKLIYTCVFSLKHGRHPLIAGNHGIGKKFLACQLADYFNAHIAEKNDDNFIDFNIKINLNIIDKNYSQNNKLIKKNEEQSIYIVYCTKSSKIEDLMGKPRVSNNKNEDLIQWQDGPLIKAVREGKPLILIGIHELQSSVLEYMNDLLDRKYDGKQRYLNNPNNPNESTIPIHRNFRLICTTLLSEINKLSPAFATRMDIKILNDQLERITETELLSLIKICMNNVKLELSSYDEDIQKKCELSNNPHKELQTDSNLQNLSKDKGRKISLDSVSSKKSYHSNQSSRSKSFSSKDSKISNNSNYSGKSIDSKGSNESGTSEKSKDSSDGSFKKRKRSVSSFSVSEESSEDNDLEFGYDNYYHFIDKERINKIISNNEISSEIIIYYDKYVKRNKEMMNMEKFSKFIRSIIVIIYKLNIDNLFTIKEIIKLIYDLLFSGQNSIIIGEQIKKYIISQNLICDPLNEYYFIGVNKLEDYMVSLYLYCLMNIPVCVYGSPGVGKTAGAECLARIRSLDEKLEGNYEKYYFNSSTNPSDIFGEFILIDNQDKLIDGPLTKSLIIGQTFIADEMNLSSNNTMMSLIPIFNSIRNRPIYFPGLQTPIKINPNFWFGAFQNYEGTAGRNVTPRELSLKLVRLDYPTLEVEDIKNICIRIRDSIFSESLNSNITDDNVLQLANFMKKFNEKIISKNFDSATNWSIGNIKCIIKRMEEQEKCEDILYKSIQYIECPIYINILFYVLSNFDLELVNDIFNCILDLVGDCFQIKEKKDELRNIYYSKPEIYYDNSTKFIYLKKYKTTIKFRNSKIGKNNIIFLNKIPSLLNTLFICLLCAETEPILILGPTGYKSYLVQLLINDVKIVLLNEESNINTLIGSTHFWNLEEIKFFYLSLICDIFDKKTKFIFLQKLKNGTLDIKDLKEKIFFFFSKKNNNCEKRIFFRDMIKKLYYKLLKIMEFLKSNNNNSLNDYILEFKPGLLTLSLIRGDSLSFENISSSYLDKFNELITGVNNFTLIKKYNTLFIPDDKIHCQLTNFIRLISTSLTKNFSVDILNKWTIINTKEYDFDELEEVLKIYSRENDLNTVTQNDIKYFIEFSKFFKNIANKNISIKLLINSIELLHKMNNNFGLFCDSEKEEKEKIYYINRQFIFYTTLKSIVELNNNKNNLSNKEINDKLYEYLFVVNKEKKFQIEFPKKQNPFLFGNKNKLNGIKSLITNAFIPCIKNKYPKIKPAFTTKFIELLNVIHLGLSLNSTIVIEGKVGQGKQTAIKYISEILGYKLLNMQLSNSYKEDDLLEKVISDKYKRTNMTANKQYETDLLKLLKNESCVDERYLIVFSDLQNACDAVKEKIANICDKHQKNVLLSDGNSINKPLLNIICVINSEINSNIRNKLPSPLLYSTIYHKIGEMSDEDIRDVTYSIFNKYFTVNSDKEAKNFIEKFNKVNSILKNNKSKQLLTFNDINYYAKLRSATIKSFDIKIVDNMIFYYREQNKDIIKELKKNLNINGFEFIPEFRYNNEYTELFIESNIEHGEPFIIKVINKDKLNINDIKKKLNSLTTQQKHCLLFLACSWNTKFKVILKGDTASGKTYCATLFAEMLGANLLIYQINQDINANIFRNQNFLEEDMDFDEINLIKKYLNNINELMPKYIKININKLIPNNPKEWLYLHFVKIFNILEIIMYDNRYEDKNRKSLIDIKSKINKIIGRFKDTESQTSSGLINGSWFLYDDIQFATPDLLSIMTPLCSDKPSLNLFNAKDSPEYSMEIENNSMNNVKLINPNFNLIMTFNQKYCKNYQGLDPILENKCLSFNLLPNDYNYESCAQIYYGGLVNSNINGDIAYQLGGKLANVHLFAKKKSLENKELFEGDSIFTSRTINRAVKYISNKIKEASTKGKDINLPNIITVAIDKLYISPYIKYNFINNRGNDYRFKFREEIINNFKKDFDNYQSGDIYNNLDYNIKLLEQLRDIQFCITEKKQKEFKFNEFIENSLNLKLKLIDIILEQIYSTLILISLNKENITKEKNLNEYYQISIVYKLLINFININDSIKESYIEKKLSDKELFYIDIYKIPIFKLKILKKLIDNNFLPQILKKEFISKVSKEEQISNESFEILVLISEMVEKPEIEYFIALVKYIFYKKESINDIVKYIEIYIPYYKFNHTNLYYINLWLPLIMKCFLKQQSFEIFFNDKIKFKYDSRSEKQKFKKLNFYFTQKNLNLSKYSRYEFNNLLKLEIDDNKNENDIFKFYYVVNNILNSSEINEKEAVKENEEKVNFKNYAFSNANRYKFFKISDLFENHTADSIGKFWMIIYNMDDKYVSSLVKLLTSYEQTIFNIFINFFNCGLYESLDKFVEFLLSLNFYNDNLFILNLEADEKYLSRKIKKLEKKINLENFIMILNNEKNKFIEINYFIEEIKKDEIVKLYEQNIRNIDAFIIQDEKEKEKNILKKKFRELSNNINDLILKKNNNLEFYKKSLLEQINLIILKEEYDNESLEIYNNKFEQLKNLNLLINTNNNKFKIRWPILMKEKKYKKSETALFLEILIWYSKIKNAIDSVKKNENKSDKLKYLMELYEFEEMKFATDVILSNDELIDEEFNLILSTLNSHYIIKMFNRNLEEYLFNCSNEINKILENNFLFYEKDINNKNDYYYIYEKEKEINYDFLIQIPQFKPKDIVFLFMQICEKNKKGDYEIKEGPILKKVKNSNRIFNILKEKKNSIFNDNFGKKTAVKTALEIIYILFENIYKSNKTLEEFEKDIFNILNKLDSNDNNQNDKQIIKIFKMTIDIAIKIDEINSKQKIKLNFDDIKFLNNDNIFKNIKYISEYPQIIYIFQKYKYLADDLIKYCKIPKDEYSSIPYWLILLRLLANAEKVKIESITECNNFMKYIPNNEKDYIKIKLVELKKDNANKVNIIWLSLIANILRNKSFFTKKSRIFYDYMFYQIQNLPKLEDQIVKIIIKNMNIFSNKLITLIFNQQFESIYDMNLDSPNTNLIKMISNPKILYKNQIEKKYFDILHNFINFESFKQLIEFYNAEPIENKGNNNLKNRPFISYYNSLKKEIDEVLKQIDEDYIRYCEKKIIKYTDKKLNELNSIMNDINYYAQEIEKIAKLEKTQKNKNKNNLNNDYAFKQFNSLIKKYEETLLEKKKNIEYIESVEKCLFKYANIEINLENIKNVSYYNEFNKIQIYNNIIILSLNSKIFKSHNISYINFDLFDDKITKFNFYIPYEDCKDYRNLISLKDEEKELNIIEKNKNTKEIYFKVNDHIYKRKIIIKIDIMNLNKYENIIINEEKVKEEMKISIYKYYNKNILNFGQEKFIKSNELLKMLEIFNIDNISFSDIINNIKDKEIFNYKNIIERIESLIKQQETISNYLKCNSSDGTQYKKIDVKLIDIKNYINELSFLLKNVDIYIKTEVKEFMQAYDIDKVSINSIFNNLEIKRPISNYEPKFNLNNINQNSEYLKALIIYEGKGKVCCSQDRIFGSFGTYISPLIKGDFSVYISSIINEKLKIRKEISIDKNELQNENIVEFKNEIDANEIFLINIKIPKKSKLEDEEFNIKFNLCLGNENLYEIKLPCNFNFILSSLKVKIKCFEYDLIYNKEELFLGTTYLEENESINFKIECLNGNIYPDFRYSYKSNDENEAKQPNMIENKDKFILNIANEYENKDISNSNFEYKLFSSTINIYITNTIFIPINIKAKIAPFEYKILAYNFYNKDNPEENFIRVYYSKEQIDYEQKLFFKIILSGRKKKYKGEIKLDYHSTEIEVIDKTIKDNFEISNSYDFNLKYQIKNKSKNDIQISMIITINSIIKKFYVLFNLSPSIFKDGNGEFNYAFYPFLIPLFVYCKNSDNEFNLKQINDTIISEKRNTSIFVTPYEKREIVPMIKRGNIIEFILDENNRNNSFFILNSEGKISNIKSNICKWELEEKQFSEKKWFFFNKVLYKYYSAKSLPLIGEYNGVWYPIINDFQLTIKDNEEEKKKIEIEEDNVPENFLNIISKISDNSFDIHTIGNLLSKEKVFHNIEDIINNLPKEIESQIYKKIGLKPISEDIKNKAEKIGINQIYTNNPDLFEGTIFSVFKENNQNEINNLKKKIIFSLMIILKERYKKLKSNGFIDLILLSEEEVEKYNKKVEDMRNIFFCINKEPIITYHSNRNNRLNFVIRKTEELENEKRKYLLEKGKEIFQNLQFIYHNDKFEFYSYDILDINTKNINTEEKNMKIESFNILSSEINLPELKGIENNLTLNKLIDFYNNAIIYTRILPIFIGNSLKCSDKKNIKLAEEKLSLLCRTYKTFIPEKKIKIYKDTSILSFYINDFIFLFERMISKLKKAGLIISDFEFDINELDLCENDIVKKPEYEKVEGKKNYWNIYIKKDTKKLNKTISQNIFVDKSFYNKKNLSTNKIDKIIDINSKSNVELSEIPKQYDSNDNIRIVSNSINKDKYFSKINEKKLITPIIIDKKSSKEIISSNKKMLSKKKYIRTTKVNIRGILFDEKMGTREAFYKIINMDKNSKFSYDYKILKSYYPSNIESKKSDILTIKDMIDNSKSFSQIFIKYFTEIEIPFLNEGVSILIDCNGNINKINKLHNMYLICGLTEGLNAIGMQYSVSLIGDENFKRVIKNYETPHSIYELQKIYECYMIPRFRANLAKSLHFAIDNLKFKSHVFGNDSNTTFIIFTDGMDENLYFGKDFKKNLFNNQNLAFEFIFIKSSFLTEEYDEILNNLWNKFISDTKDSASKIQIDILENNYKIEKSEHVIKMIVNILSRNSESKNYSLRKLKLEKPIFEISNNEELDQNTLDILETSFENDYSLLNKIFYNISEIHFKKLKPTTLDNNAYIDKIGKVIDCRISNTILNKYNTFFKNLIGNTKEIDLTNLNYIFLPNKASNMILSKIDSKKDILAFINYIFENSQNPMVCLEEKGWFSKHYSLSIIIDSSLSCLNKFSFPHTIQTVRTLISSIASINIPAVDIIIATSTNPIVICSDIPSIKLLGKSNLLSSLFKVLSKPCLKANLPSALKVAKDLQKIGSKDTTKYMFVLTDGLYQQNELDLIKNRIFDCMQTSLLIGIGVGFYPLKIKNLFIQSIYVPNPLDICAGIEIAASKINNKYTSTMPHLPILTTKKEEEIIEKLSKQETIVNKELIEELLNIEAELECFSFFE